MSFIKTLIMWPPLEYHGLFQLYYNVYSSKLMDLIKNIIKGGSVVAQLVEQSFPTPEICGLNPNFGKKNTPNCPF